MHWNTIRREEKQTLFASFINKHTENYEYQWVPETNNFDYLQKEFAISDKFKYFFFRLASGIKLLLDLSMNQVYAICLTVVMVNKYCEER